MSKWQAEFLIVVIWEMILFNLKLHLVQIEGGYR